MTADGQPRRHWASPEMWVTCGLGPYNFDFMTAVNKEIMSRYRVDGIFINRWDGSGMCYCAHCAKNFKAATGFDLPRTNNPQDPARRAYMLWRQQRLFDLWQTWDRAVREINPDSCIIPNTGGGASSSLDMKQIGELAPILMADRQARSGLMAPWAVGKNAKEYRATLGLKPIIGIFSIGLEEPGHWKGSVQNGAEIQLWVADLVANGMRPWFAKFGGVVYDGRWLKAGRRYISPARGLGKVFTQRAAARPRGRGLFAADAIGAAPAGMKVISTAGTRRSSKRAFPLSWSTTACWRPRSEPLQDAHPAEHRRVE